MWGSVQEDRGTGLSLGAVGTSWDAGVRGGPTCEESRCFPLGGVPSLQSNLQLLGGQVFNKGAGRGTFPRQMLQLWYNYILITKVDHRAEGCSGTSHPTGLEPPSGRHQPKLCGRFTAVPAAAPLLQPDIPDAEAAVRIASIATQRLLFFKSNSLFALKIRCWCLK